VAGNVVPIARATGPRSLVGKRRSALNALKGGLYASSTVLRHVEDVGEFNNFSRAILADLDARSTLEVVLAERLCSALWRGRRIRRYETRRLSELADRAPLITKIAAKVRLSAHAIRRYATAITALDSRTSVEAETLMDAALGFDCVYGKIEGAEEASTRLGDDLSRLARRPRASSKAVRAALAVARDAMPSELAENGPAAFAESTAKMLFAVADNVEREADANDDAAERAHTNALLLDPNEAARVDDAERRIDRQIARALTDLQTARGLTTPRAIESQFAETGS